MTTTAGAGLAGVTYAFVPPEALMGTNFSTASDMYALGIIICMIGTGASPYGETLLPAVMVCSAVTVWQSSLLCVPLSFSHRQ